MKRNMTDIDSDKTNPQAPHSKTKIWDDASGYNPNTKPAPRPPTTMTSENEKK